MPQCIVIGSGIAGIAAAIRLRALGYGVTVFEANDFPGGKLSEFTQDGFRFDAGPSLFTMPQFVEELFELSGENPADHFAYKRLDMACHYFFEDGTRFECPSDPDAFVRKAGEVFGEQPGRISRFLNKSRKLYDITAPVFLERSLHKLSTYLSKTGLRGIANLWRLDVFRSMHRANTAAFSNPKTVQLFNRYATYNGSNPYKAPATLNIIPHLEFGFGTYFPLGGMHSITMSLYQLALRKGVEFRFGEPVREILHKKGRVLGVAAGSNTFSADLVICNMDVFSAYQKLLPGVGMPRKIKQAESSSSALIFYWGIAQTFSELDVHNIFFSADYRLEFERIFGSAGIAEDPTVYINITSKHKQDDAPDASENWFVMVNVPANTGQDWDRLIAEARENILAKLSRMLHTDLKPLIKTERILDPRSIEARTFSHRGALYGSSSNNRMSAFFRQANFSSDIRNLYFCGGSVHPGGGIPLCLLSAKIVAGLVPRS